MKLTHSGIFRNILIVVICMMAMQDESLIVDGRARFRSSPRRYSISYRRYTYYKPSYTSYNRRSYISPGYRYYYYSRGYSVTYIGGIGGFCVVACVVISIMCCIGAAYLWNPSAFNALRELELNDSYHSGEEVVVIEEVVVNDDGFRR